MEKNTKNHWLQMYTRFTQDNYDYTMLIYDY